MQQHDGQNTGKSGRRVRQKLQDARRAGTADRPEADSEDGTPIAEETVQAGGDSANRSRRRADGGSMQAVNTLRVLERLTTDRDTADRLGALRARQQRLPLDVEAGQSSGPARTRAKQTRDELVERLLDPVLTLQETAILLDVCPTTVRRYTNRGVLNCFRTPGNQRRFRLSDVISFMERRDNR